MPKISIIVPVYNAGKYLEKCLNSLKSQSFIDIEILCVNDGSVDNSLEILNKFSETDTRFRLFSQPNAGPARARNVGLENMQGEFVMFCDADDTYQPDMCAQMYQTIMDKNVDVVMCNTAAYKKDLTEEKNLYYFPFKEGKYNLNQDLIPKINVYLWNKIFLARHIRQFRIDFPEGHKADDNLFIYKYLMSAKNIYFLDKKLYNHFERENSIMDLYHSKGIKLNDLFDKSDIMVLLWDYLKDREILDQNRGVFLSRLYTELIYSWANVPKIWEKDFLSNLLKNMRHIGLENLRYSDVRKRTFFEVLDIENFYAAGKMLDIFLLERKIKRRKYIFQENPKPFFSENAIGFICNCDDRFVSYFSVVLESIMEHSSAENNYDIIVLHTDITDENQEKIKSMILGRNNFSLRFFDMMDYEQAYQISEYKTINHVKTAAYYRLFIPKIFEAYEKVIYLDSDIIVHTDIWELARVDLKNYSCAAVVDYFLSQILQEREMGFKGLYEYGKNVLKFTNWKSYFNSGVMVYNIPKMIQKRYLEQFIKMAKINNRFFNDQNVLNSVLQGDVLLLGDEWNMQINDGGFVLFAHLLPIKQIKILHFCSQVKPWNNPKILFADIWWYYARKSPFYEIILKENLSGRGGFVNTENHMDASHILAHPIYYSIKKAFYKLKKNYGKKRKRDKYQAKYTALKQAIKEAKRMKKKVKF